MNKTGSSKFRWFVRGFAAGFILFAALNATSWFFRSSGWSDLCGATQAAHTEAIGFPLELWREGVGYKGGLMMSVPSLAVNAGVGLLVAVIAGLTAVRMSPQIEAMLPDERTGDSKGFRLTFSVRGLLIVTTLIAFAVGLTQALGSSPWLLGVIYFAGPLTLILIAMGPVGIPWEQRSVILVLTAIFMLTGAILIGGRLGMLFDQVLLGVFICWVPQSVFAALLIFSVTLWKHRLSSK